MIYSTKHISTKEEANASARLVCNKIKELIFSAQRKYKLPPSITVRVEDGWTVLYHTVMCFDGEERERPILSYTSVQKDTHSIMDFRDGNLIHVDFNCRKDDNPSVSICSIGNKQAQLEFNADDPLQFFYSDLHYLLKLKFEDDISIKVFEGLNLYF